MSTSTVWVLHFNACFTTQKHPGAEIELFERDLILEIRGSKTTRRRAKKYCKGVMDQRTGPVNVTQASSHNS